MGTDTAQQLELNKDRGKIAQQMELKDRGKNSQTAGIKQRQGKKQPNRWN